MTLNEQLHTSAAHQKGFNKDCPVCKKQELNLKYGPFGIAGVRKTTAK